MSVSEMTQRLPLISISLSVQEQQRVRRHSQENPPPLPYMEFSIFELLHRAVSGPQVGDIIKTKTLSLCVIQEVRPDGTYVGHSAYWDYGSRSWRAPNTVVRPSEVNAFLGHTFNQEIAKQNIVVEPEY